MRPDDHYCVHLYHDHIDVYDHAGHGNHRRLDDVEHRAFIHVLIAAALHDDPAAVLNAIDDDHDFIRALDKRRDEHAIDTDDL